MPPTPALGWAARHCVHANGNSGQIIQMATCTGKPDQQFVVRPGAAAEAVIITQPGSGAGGMCVTACGSAASCGPPPPPPTPPPPGSCPTFRTKAACPPVQCRWTSGGCVPPPPPPAPPYTGLNYTCNGPWEAGHCHAPCEHANFSGLPYCNRSLDLDTRVADAVARLSLGEKISNTMASVSGL